MASFNREARVGALLRHPNAHTVIDKGTYDDQPFLIFPYVEGANLAALMAGDSRPPIGSTITILLDVLRGLQHAHDLTDEQGTRVGLIHSDVSPENVLIGIDGVARLTDFGSAHFASASSAEEQTGHFGLGKASYMAPEQLRGDPLDARTDIFAVGVMMWTALTGQKLFSAETYDQTVMRVLRKKIPPPSTLGAPPCFDEVCLQALSRAPEGRFDSADGMADALMTAAVTSDLIDSRDQVAVWIRREMGETLAERRRRIDLMFGDKSKTRGLRLVEDRGTGHGRKAIGRADVTVATMATILTGAPVISEAAARSLPAKTLFIPMSEPDGQSESVSEPEDAVVSASEQKLSRREWSVIATVSLMTFVLTLVVGIWIARRAFPSKREASRSQTSGGPALVDAAPREAGR